MNVINIRGSHGSGKSFVVRQAMVGLPEPVTTFMPDGKHIEGYTWNQPPLFVLGKYIQGISTGGGDTIRDINDMEEIVVRQADAGRHVLYEGIRIHAGHARWIEAARKHKQHEWYFIILKTTVEQSMENIRARLALVGKEPGPKVRESVIDHFRRGQRQIKHFKRAGLRMEYLSSDEAAARVKELL